MFHRLTPVMFVSRLTNGTKRGIGERNFAALR
jgi:hypothetical protein